MWNGNKWKGIKGKDGKRVKIRGVKYKKKINILRGRKSPSIPVSASTLFPSKF